MFRRLAKPVQGEWIGRLQRKRRVVRLHAVTPDTTIRADHGCWMSINRQYQTLSRMTIDLIVTLGSIPVVDQHAILIRKMLPPVAKIPVIQESKVVWADLQILIVYPICAILDHVIVGIVSEFLAACHPEASERPTRISLSAISFLTADLETQVLAVGVVCG